MEDFEYPAEKVRQALEGLAALPVYHGDRPRGAVGRSVFA